MVPRKKVATQARRKRAIDRRVLGLTTELELVY